MTGKDVSSLTGAFADTRSKEGVCGQQIQRKDLGATERVPRHSNRHVSNGSDVYITYNMIIHPLDVINLYRWSVISNSDVVYPSTASSDILVAPDQLRESLSTRNRPGGIQFVDISVPRNVDPVLLLEIYIIVIKFLN